MLSFVRTAAALAGLLSSAAFAADLPARGAPPAAPIFAQMNWSGPYIGAHAAYVDGAILDRGCVGLCAANVHVRKPYLAVQGGYDWHLPSNLVIGVFGWIAVTPIQQSVALAPGVVFTGRARGAGFLGSRLGYAFGNFLPYVFGGYQILSLRVSSPVAPIPRVNNTHGGFGIGVGGEYAITQNWSVDARYMYSRLSREAYNFGGGVTTAAARVNTFSLGVNYRFGSM